MDPYKEQNADHETDAGESVHSVSKFIEHQKLGMLTTHRSDGLLVSRAMAVAAVEGAVDLVFHTNLHQHKVDEIKSDSHVNVSFYKESSGEWASVSGIAKIDSTAGAAKQYYNPILKAWLGDLRDGVHDGSANDPRLGIIRVKALTVTYAVNRNSSITNAVTTLKAMFTGETPSVVALRELGEIQLEAVRKSHV